MDCTLAAGPRSPRRPDHQASIATVIDELGKASAKAQQLTAPITSASKLQSQRHELYLLKDAERNGGQGVIVGFIKIGYKKLFLLDSVGEHVEAEPLCVLDFYIAENLQRHGYGLELFDFMLQHRTLDPVLMAYDRPSEKFLSFLAKHYDLTQSVPQVNNFVVFKSFFLNKSVSQSRKAPVNNLDREIKPYSLTEREVVRQEQRSLPWPFASHHSPQHQEYLHSISHTAALNASPRRVAVQASPTASRDQSPQSRVDRSYPGRLQHGLN